MMKTGRVISVIFLSFLFKPIGLKSFNVMNPPLQQVAVSTLCALFAIR